MVEIRHLADQKKASALLQQIIQKNSNEQAWTWFNKRTEKYASTQKNSDLFLSFSAAVRFMGKNTVQLQENTLAEWENIRPGFRPQNWTLAQLARTYFLLQIPSDSIPSYIDTLDKLFAAADMGELTTLYTALPLYPHPESLTLRTAEGIRTNMSVIFDAIAHHNPYPAEYLEDIAWNQLILKAIFMERPIYLIQNADYRKNKDLARMLVDFAHERWAAGRLVTPELWRFVGPHINEDNFGDIQKLLQSEDSLEVEAACLACAESEWSASKETLTSKPEIQARIAAGELNWEELGARYALSKTSTAN